MKNFPIVKSRRLRSTPYTDRIESHGVSSYTVYNHMLLPASFKSLESDYEHLKKFVQVWDVAAERQVEISGKDSAKLVQLMTCRDLSKSKVGKCYYSPLIDEEGLLVNDPIIATKIAVAYISSKGIGTSESSFSSLGQSFRKAVGYADQGGAETSRRIGIAKGFYSKLVNGELTPKASLTTEPAGTNIEAGKGVDQPISGPQ